MHVGAKQLQAYLEAAFTDATVEVDDDSERHRGHSGWREGGGTHFRVRVVSPDFAGLNSVARHRRVYQVLADALAEQIHALNIDARTPGENALRGGGR